MGLLRRTHTCGELRQSDVGQSVVLNGWVNSYRAYPDQVFIDLRDRYGLTQVVFEPEAGETVEAARALRNEFVIGVKDNDDVALTSKNSAIPTGAHAAITVVPDQHYLGKPVE